MSNKLLFFIFGLLVALTFQKVSSISGLAVSPFVESPGFIVSSSERPSPSDTISEDDIRVYHDQVRVSLSSQDGDDWLLVLDLDDPSWSRFLDTNSMDPLIDKGSNAVRIRVPCDELFVGDIISYQYQDSIIIHRIVHKEVDEKGIYFVAKGDNNPTSDPGKIRCDQVLGKVVAILY